VAVHHAAGEEERVKGDIYGSLLWTTVFSVALALAVTLLAPEIAAGFFHKPAFAAPLIAFVWWVPPTALVIVLVSAVLAAGSAQARVAVRDFLVPAIFLALGPAAVVVWHSAAAAGVAYTFSAVVGLALAFYYLYRFFPGLRAGRAVCDQRLLVALALPLMLTDLAAASQAQADRIVVGRLVGAADIAVYINAVQLALVATLALTALNQIQAPVISRLYHQGKRAELDALLKTFTRLCLTGSAPLCALLIGLAGPLMGILGPPYAAGAPVLIIASLGVLVNVATASVGMSLMMTGHQWLVFGTSVGSLALLVAGVWWLTPVYGIAGAAIGLAGAMAASNLANLLLEVRFVRVNPWTPAMLKSLAAAAVCGLVAWGLAHVVGLTGQERLRILLPADLGVAAISLAVYAGLIWLLGVEESDKAAARAVGERLRKK
jgi:O-antigen/teichoic acid export membrane protein